MRRALVLALGVWTLSGRRHLGLIAAGVAFFAMLSVFPALGVIVALVSLWADAGQVTAALEPMAEFLPPDAYALLATQSTALASAKPLTLGLTGLVSLVGTLWSARRGVAALMRGLRAIHGGRAREKFQDVLVALGLTLAAIAAGATSVVTMVLLPIGLALLAPSIPGDGSLQAILKTARWVVALVVIVLGLGVFYRFGPNTKAARDGPFLSPGLGLAVALWVLVSVAFTLFVNAFGTYNEVYGTLGAAIALMVWFQLSAYVVLLGAAMNRVLAMNPGGVKPVSDKTDPPATG